MGNNGFRKMDSFKNLVHNLSRVLNIFSGITLAIMMGLVFVNVLMRAVWEPILGTYEYTSFLASMTIALALAHCATRKGHIMITIFAERLPEKVQAGLDVLVAILGTCLYLILAWQCSKYAISMYHSGEVGLTTEIPFYPFIFLVAFGVLILALVLLIDLFESLRRVFAR
ncbi:MAG: TRAP transporter small permease [Deltaproteobacteria bacterium]|nr:TRAP transporter small permease [Deltaproteobacteria bacterium]MBW2137234.1 TRAP transporter small permease [Deltaproteobacteria bacterium]